MTPEVIKEMRVKYAEYPNYGYLTGNSISAWKERFMDDSFRTNISLLSKEIGMEKRSSVN